MDFVAFQTAHASRELVSGGRRSSSAESIAGIHAKEATTAGEAADPAYWTPYDHFMIEREARVYRRAFVYSMLGTLVKRVRKGISSFGTRRA